MVKYMVFTTPEYCAVCNEGIYDISMPKSLRSPGTETSSYSHVFQNEQKTLWAFLVSEDDTLYIHPQADFSMILLVFAELIAMGAMNQQEVDRIITMANAHKGMVESVFSFLPAYTISVLRTTEEMEALGFFARVRPP